MARICVFDVNETLLDLGALDPVFEGAFGDAGARREWFLQMLQSAFVSTITGSYSPFGEIGAAALKMTAERRGVTLTEENQTTILGGMRELPPHPEVPDALDRLRDAGIRLAALTNSTQAVAEAQLAHAGLTERFERILSADTVRRLKPAPEPYRAAARELGAEVSDTRLVAAHTRPVTWPTTSSGGSAPCARGVWPSRVPAWASSSWWGLCPSSAPRARRTGRPRHLRRSIPRRAVRWPPTAPSSMRCEACPGPTSSGDLPTAQESPPTPSLSRRLAGRRKPPTWPPPTVPISGPSFSPAMCPAGGGP